AGAFTSSSCRIAHRRPLVGGCSASRAALPGFGEPPWKKVQIGKGTSKSMSDAEGSSSVEVNGKADDSGEAHFQLGGHRMASRMLVLSLLGIVVGVAGGFVAEGLLRSMNFISNLCFYGRVTADYLPPNAAPHHWWMPLLPAAGGLLVGLLIHYFSPEIKGDGIPEAMSVALTNRSIVKPRVSVFKPVSAALTVGSGG